MIFGGNSLYMDGVGRKIEGSVAQVKVRNPFRILNITLT